MISTGLGAFHRAGVIAMIVLLGLPGCTLLDLQPPPVATPADPPPAQNVPTAPAQTLSALNTEPATAAMDSAAVKVVDRDRDGIDDSRDKCLNTAPRAGVDTHGCALDTDGDTVADYQDACRGTPKGVKVDGRGCGFDDDRDGVPNYRDSCANTPADVGVDGNGCEWDSDNDGVADSKDQCAGTPPGLPVEPMGCVLVRMVTLRGMNFQVGSYMLNGSAREMLGSVAATLRRHPKMRVEIAGHTDNIGSGALNQALSLERAQAARDYLVEQGVNAAVLSTKGYAEQQPLADNGTEQGRYQNRRVEVRIVEID